ncbi:helix-turn-helix transcriptional regulator [Bacillaceae bacterium S4-13-58]
MGKFKNHNYDEEEYIENLAKEPGPFIGKVVKRNRIAKRREVRKKGAWTQADLAEKIELTEKHVQKLEAGRTKDPYFSTVAAILDALDLTYEEFQQQVKEEQAKYIAKQQKNKEEPDLK